MELNQLGFDNWFRNEYKKNPMNNLDPARIIAVNRDNFIIKNSLGECQAELTGRLIYTLDSGLDRPTVGDWVLIQSFDNFTLAIIHDILPRKTLLKRKEAGTKTEFQLLAANIDVAFIMQATDFNINRLERYLVMVHDGGINPVVLLNKSDLFSQSEIQERIRQVKNLQGQPEVIALSNFTNQNIDLIKNYLQPAQTYCLLGSSGVGKTTLLNNLTGGNDLAVASVREKDGRGRHTTTKRQLIVLENGSLIIDTPGMRELGNFLVQAGLELTFEDIRERANNCRFSDCTHIHEKGCAVIEAVRVGHIEESHYNNYLKLQKESDYLERSYFEKRKRDKEFGKMCKRVMKDKRKK